MDRLLGEGASWAVLQAREAIIEGFEDRGEITLDEVASGSIRRGSAQTAFKQLEDEDIAEKLGEGKRGDPFRYRRRM